MKIARAVRGLAGALGVALVGWASVPYVGQRLPLLRPHIWVRVPQAVVSLDGKPTDCTVYRSYDGNLLLWMYQPVVLFPAAGAIQPVLAGLGLPDMDGGDPHSFVHVLICGRFALVEEDAYRCAFGEDNEDGAPHAILRPGYVEFNPAGEPHVCVKF